MKSNEFLTPLVSICCLTFNHGPFITQTIEGFLRQKTAFSFEIIIHDDASTDNAPKIIQDYALKYPNLIFPILQKENYFSRGINPAAAFVFPNSKGKYLAVCEGDDYWTDPCKLQKQVDFLEANPEYDLIATDVVLVDSEGNLIPDNEMVLKQRSLRKEDIGFYDLLHSNLINTLTVCVRTDIMKELALEALSRNLWFAIDKWFWLNIALKHKIRLSYEKTAAYRIHPGGISRTNNFMSDRTSFIYYDVLVKLFKTTNIKNLKADNKITLARRCLNLVISGNLGIRERLFLIWKFVRYPSLFMALVVSLRKG